MRLRFGDAPRPRWDIGVICFRGSGGSQAVVKRLGARPVTDALYRETRADVRRWLALGARAVNMETAPLYAAAAACGVRSLWLGHVSDSLLDDDAWDSWHRPAALTDVTVELLVALLGDRAGRPL